MYCEKFLETIKLLKSLFFVDTLYSKRTQRKLGFQLALQGHSSTQDIRAFGHSVTEVPGYLGTRGTLFRKLNFLFIVNKQ